MIRKLVDILLGIIILSSCTSIYNAQHNISVADSLRLIGCSYTDTSTIAQTAFTLSKFKYLFPTDYAKANYYYGRLLRENGNQDGAMQCFINVLHSNTHDKDLRGRTLTNIAIMCRLEGNHQLAYEMFDKSREQFMANNDAIAYYYAVNNMAFELAEQAKIEECLSLLNQIDENCTNTNVHIKTFETKAEAYFVAQKYDTAIYYANQLQQYGNHEPTGMLIKAQSYSYLGVKDSAVYYASLVASQSTSLFDLNNSLYIIANDNPNARIDDIQQAHASRSDVQKQIEQRRSDLSHAVELLEQDINKKTNYWKVIIFILAIVVIVLISLNSHYKIQRKRRQVEIQTHREQQKQLRLRQEQDKLKAETKQILSINDKLLQRQALLMQQQAEYVHQQEKEIERICEALRNSHNIKKELHWSNYDQMCEIVNAHFNFIANKLKATNLLSETEIKLCILVLINLRFNQISEILPYAQNSVGKLKDTAAKHLKTTGKMLRKTLLNMVIEKY